MAANGTLKIPVKPLGSSGLKTSIQGLGCMGMSAFYSDADHSADEEECIAIIHRAAELGVTFLDTSNIYGPFTNEELVGKAIKGRREQYTVATKFAFNADWTIDCSPKAVRAACEGSLKRLGISTIDLYYMHRMDPKVPIEETVGEMKKLVGEGKVRYLGLSEVGASEIRRAHKVHPITAVQLEWSLWTRDAEAEVIPTCRELGIGIVAYSPLGRGFLAGKYKSPADFQKHDFRAGLPRFTGEAFEKNLAMVKKVEELAAKKGTTASALALAWVHSQGVDVFPIPGTKRMHYLEQNAKAATLELSAEDIKLLLDAVPAAQVVGERYGESQMQMTHQHLTTPVVG